MSTFLDSTTPASRSSTTRSPASQSSRASAPTATATAITASVIRIYDAFLRQSDLSPSPAVNAIFSELVSLCIQPYTSATVVQVLSDKRIRNLSAQLRKICSTGEYLLERHWTGQILAADDGILHASWTTLTYLTPLTAYAALRLFPYYDNYMDLARLEINAIQSVHPNPIESIAFIGSGPLPLTSLCFSALLSPPPKRLHNIDNCPHAIADSSKLCARLTGNVPAGPDSINADKLSFQLADAAEVQDLRSFEVVFLAGLVGDTEKEKRRILGKVVAQCKEGALVVLRSAHGLRKLLYQQIGVGVLAEFGLEVLLVVHPWNHVVNSVVVCRVTGVGARARL
jgi:nicotianamine synthase